MMGAMEKPLIIAKNAFCEIEMAIQEITRGCELTKQIQSMLLLLGEKPTLELPAGVLFEEVLQALTMALTNLKSSTCDPKTYETSSVSLLDDQHRSETSNEIQSGSRKRRKVIPWTKVTYAPHDDGYQWRKYGQKNIQKSRISRSYYRCTYKDEGCQATKHVEEKDCNDAHLFSVTYYAKHTCRASNTDPIIITPEIQLDQVLLPKEPNLFSFESNAAIFSSLKASGSPDSINEQERVDLPNIRTPNDQKAATESVAKSEDCLGAMLDAWIEGEGILTSACLSPPWEAMSMDFLVQSSFGYDDTFAFPCF